MPVTDQVYVDIITQTQQGTRGLADMATGALKAYVSLQSLKRIAEAAFAAFKELTQAYYESERGLARVGAVLTATGKSTTLSTEKIKLLADEMEALTGIDDDVTVSAAAMALTFDSVTEDTLPRLMRVAGDLSAVMGTDLPSAVQTLGMALEDPEAGMTRLRRAGVVLDQQTQTLIRSLVDQGDTAAASGKLLSELEDRVTGVAEAMHATAAGGFTDLKNAFDGIKKSIGETLAELAKPGMEKLTGWIQGATSGIERTKTVREAMGLNSAEAREMSFDALMEMRDVVADVMWEVANYKNLDAGGKFALAVMAGNKDTDRAYWQQLLDKIDGWIQASEARAITAERERAAEGGGTAAGGLPPAEEAARVIKSLGVDEIAAKLDESSKALTILASAAKGDGIHRKTAINGGGGSTWEDMFGAPQPIVSWDETSGGPEYDVILTAISDAAIRAKDAMESLQQSMIDLATSSAIDSLWAIGEAIGAGAKGSEDFADAMRDIGMSIMRELPMLFLKAGLEVLPVNPALGAALLAAAGISAVAGGYLESQMPDSSYGGGGSSGSGSSRYRNTIVVQGSLIAEREVDRLAYKALSRMGRGY